MVGVWGSRQVRLVYVTGWLSSHWGEGLMSGRWRGKWLEVPSLSWSCSPAWNQQVGLFPAKVQERKVNWETEMVLEGPSRGSAAIKACDPGHGTVHRDVWLLVYKAGPVRAALTSFLVVLWWLHWARGVWHRVQIADTGMGSRCAYFPDLKNHLKLFYL